ncbi:OTU-like cysteine protease [Medicago truncatula]|uniref:Ubiquitin thioesterase OTU n=1 Tax=Medicago truncatula TaxID=3880 RepID=A0A072VHR1_MEDTR|nr:OTU-like cysteine protease [Medicago truncatula]
MGRTTRGGYFGSCFSKQSGNNQVITSPQDCASDEKNGNDRDKNAKASCGNEVYKEYSVIGIPGDGRCMFRSIAHGARLRSGKPPPSESIQRELADDLRDKVADEYVKRKEQMKQWFIEGDFESNISQIRKPHVWGDEPELFIASHVLQMPIAVYVYDPKAGGLISKSEYGQEYGKENPIRVLYNGFTHYDALEFPISRRKGSKSRLWHFTFQMLKRLKAFI